MFDKKILSLYFIAGTQDCRHLPTGSPEQKLLGVLETALQNGVTCFQFREKGAFSLENSAKMHKLAHDCRDLCRQYAVPFVVNNDVVLAVKMGADGVHIGQQDMSPEQAARLCDNKLFLGISNSNVAHLQRSLSLNYLDYLAVGAIFPTQSKPDATAPVGVDFVRVAREMCGNKPLVAIGGICADTAPEIRAAGADGVAVISAITQAENVAAAVQKLRA